MEDGDNASADRSDEPSDSHDQSAPDLNESLRQIDAAGRASLDALGAAGKTLRSLLAADVALARSALARTLTFAGVALVFGASAWLLAMSALVVFISRQLGWPWWLALLACALLSLLVTIVAISQAMRYFEHTRMQATRRQLARLGVGVATDADAAPDPAEHAANSTP